MPDETDPEFDSLEAARDAVVSASAAMQAITSTRAETAAEHARVVQTCRSIGDELGQLLVSGELIGDRPARYIAAAADEARLRARLDQLDGELRRVTADALTACAVVDRSRLPQWLRALGAGARDA